ncbi:hypothetical protein C8J56DRAFT_887055 [Mycena floridula]|nr:hypothetical protein C8J56DRAFT_887055 [Mycena floridula]
MSEPLQSRPLTDSDIFALKEFLLQTAVQFLGHGIYSGLVMIVLYSLWTNKAQLPARRILIVATISMFLASTTQLAIALAYYLIQLLTAGFDPPNVEGTLIYMNIPSDALVRLNYLIGESIVVWRAWVLWTNHSRVHKLLIVCLVGSFVGASADLIFSILYDLSLFSSTPRFPPTGLRTLILTLSLFLTNSVSTLLMGYKVWEYKVEIKRNLGLSQNNRTKVERVLILLTESGSIYCLLWLSMLVFGLESSNNDSLSYEIITIILPQIVLSQAIYPILIILLVALEKANLETTVTGSSFSQPIKFAEPQVSTETHGDVPPDSTTIQLASLRSDPNTEDVLDSGMDDAAVGLPVENESFEEMEKHFFELTRESRIRAQLESECAGRKLDSDLKREQEERREVSQHNSSRNLKREQEDDEGGTGRRRRRNKKTNEEEF